MRYLAANTPFHFDDGGTPTGGFFWDGRADSLAAQSGSPLLGMREMANPDKAAVVAKIASASWAEDFKAFYGADILADTDRAFGKLGQALQRFQLEDVQFNEITANWDPSHFDLGLCGRADLAAREDLCGAFKVPSLRNVALRQVYFHNGKFKSLKDALTFYVQRDTSPEKWYPRNPDDSVNKFNDLPPAWRANVNTTESPCDRKPGDAPALSDEEIEDVIAFLRPPTGGWRGD